MSRMSRLGCFAMLVLAMAENQTHNATENGINGIKGSVATETVKVPGIKVKSASSDVTVTILHISDTHSLHRSTGDLPAADILIHSGDVAKVGSDSELGDFNQWLSTISYKYKHMLVIPGNHDFMGNKRFDRGELAESAARSRSPNYLQRFQSKITNAKVMNHEMVEVLGLKIWGAGWQPGNDYSEIPAGVDIVVTHEAAFGIFDLTGGGHWGSSNDLLGAIYRAKPKVHLFGHIHEQRGHWDRSGDHFEGGVEYRPSPDTESVFQPNDPPAQNYPVEVVSNNAMANQRAVDHSWTGVWAPMHIVGRGRLIVAKKEGDAWHFTSTVP